MSAAAPNRGWPLPRIFLGIALLTAAQAAIVGWVGLVPGPPPARTATAPETTLLWDATHREIAFAGVPPSRLDTFARHPSDPFQSVASGSLPRTEYRLAEWREPLRWLTNPVVLNSVAAKAPPTPPRPISAARPPVPTPEVRPLVATQTTVQVSDNAATRAWLKPPALGPWEGSELPGTTRIEAAVNPQGWIVMARVTESSGVKAADEQARQAVKAALFKPEPGAPRRPAIGSTNVAWTTITINWTSQPAVR